MGTSGGSGVFRLRPGLGTRSRMPEANTFSGCISSASHPRVKSCCGSSHPCDMQWDETIAAMPWHAVQLLSVPKTGHMSNKSRAQLHRFNHTHFGKSPISCAIESEHVLLRVDAGLGKPQKSTKSTDACHGETSELPIPDPQ